MNVLVGLHHADLWWSLDLLFQKRLGWKLYRPYGISWYDEGYYRIYGDLRRKDPYKFLAKQYLEDTIHDYNGETGIGRETYEGCVDFPPFNLLTLEQAKQTPIDIIICSVNENEPYFAKLKEFHPNAKFVRHVGNGLDTNINAELYPNLLSSAVAPYNAFKGHKVLYRQEFDLELFKPLPPYQFKNIYSFQNGLEFDEPAWEEWVKLKHQLRDYTFKSYGVSNDNGRIYPKREYISRMLEASFIFQVKEHEGYGHVIHNAICLGRPMIIRRKDYAGRLADSLLVENETYLEIDKDLPDKIKHYSEPSRLKEMSRKCAEKFREVVDFDAEFVEIKKFMEELI